MDSGEESWGDKVERHYRSPEEFSQEKRKKKTLFLLSLFVATFLFHGFFLVLSRTFLLSWRFMVNSLVILLLAFFSYWCLFGVFRSTFSGWGCGLFFRRSAFPPGVSVALSVTGSLALSATCRWVPVFASGGLTGKKAIFVSRDRSIVGTNK